MFKISKTYFKFTKKHFSTKFEIFTLPFKITKTEALEILSKNHHSFEKDISNNNKYISKHLHKIYIPFHTASIKNLASKFSGQKGFDRTEYYVTLVPNANGKGSHLATRSRTVTDWYDVNGKTSPTNYNTNLEKHHMHIYAGFDYPKEYVTKSLVITSVPKKDFIRLTMPSDSTVLPHNMNYAKAFNDILNELLLLEKSRAKKTIYESTKCDRTQITNVHMLMENAELESFFLSYSSICLYCRSAWKKNM